MPPRLPLTEHLQRSAKVETQDTADKGGGCKLSINEGVENKAMQKSSAGRC